MLVDSHCHLDFPEFADDLDGVVARARGAGVETLLTIGTHLSRFENVHAIAQRFADVWCTVGIHPHEAGREAADLDTLVRLAENPKVVGFGETGLDYFYEHAPREAQQKSFRIHLEAARRTGLPVVIHTRDADDDTARILTDEFEKGPFKGLVHCFSSGEALARQALDLGLCLSVSGIVTFPKAQGVRDVLAGVPVERLLVETDAPYLAPVPFRGKRNEPAHVVHTAARVAEVKGVSAEAFAALSSETFFALFSKVQRPG